MVRDGQTMAEAFETLKTQSQLSNRKHRNVAESHIEEFESDLSTRDDDPASASN
jgi:hypothetical protein